MNDAWLEASGPWDIGRVTVPGEVLYLHSEAGIPDVWLEESGSAHCYLPCETVATAVVR